jgi:hypothetical protein
MSEEQKITIYWEAKVEHKKVISGTEEEINSIVEMLSLGDSNTSDFLENHECTIKTHQTSESELEFYEVEDVEA